MPEVALPTTFVAIDVETASREPRSLCALGTVGVVDERVVWEARVLIRPPSSRITLTHIHGLTWADVKDAEPFDTLWRGLCPLLREFETWVAHNAAFERRVLRAACRDVGLAPPRVRWACTMALSQRYLGPDFRALPSVCMHLGIPLNHHDPLSDARAAALILCNLRHRGQT